MDLETASVKGGLAMLNSLPESLWFWQSQTTAELRKTVGHTNIDVRGLSKSDLIACLVSARVKDIQRALGVSDSDPI